MYDNMGLLQKPVDPSLPIYMYFKTVKDSFKFFIDGNDPFTP